MHLRRSHFSTQKLSYPQVWFLKCLCITARDIGTPIETLHKRFSHVTQRELDQSIRLEGLRDHFLLNFNSPRDKMQRSGFPPTPTSPPLHHPVPQHVSSIPMMRSPPPPPGSATGYTSYGSQPLAPQPGITPIHPAYGGFFNDHTAQMGYQVGRTAYMAGQEYVEQNVGCIFWYYW